MKLFILSALFALTIVQSLAQDGYGFLDLPTRCKYQRDPGPCRAALQRYYYDVTTGGCKKFTYGGCGGNSNNFKSLTQCEGQCVNI